MTTGFRLGLIGWELAGSAGVKPFDHDADRLDLVVDYGCASVADAKAVRQQILGYVEHGAQPVLPLTWDEDSDLDGYYRLTAASVETNKSFYNAGRVVARFALARIRGFSAPTIESLYYGSYRSFIPAGAGAIPWVAVPTTWPHWTSAEGVPGTRLTSTTAGLDIKTYTGYQESVFAYAPPAAFYDAAVMLRVGDHLEVQTGRQTISRPTQWTLDNGLVRVSSSEDSSSMISISTRLYDGSRWSTRAKRLVAGIAGPTANTDTFTPWPVVTPLSITPIKVSPEECVISLLYAATTVGRTLELRISLRRGARLAHVTVMNPTQPTSIYPGSYFTGLRYTSGFTGTGAPFGFYGVIPTAYNYGLAEPATDSDGAKSLLIGGGFHPYLDTTGGIVAGIADVPFEVGVGSEVYTLGFVEPKVDLSHQFMAATTEVQRVVSR